MTRRRVRGRAALAAASLVALAALSGCAAGFDAGTLQVDSPGQGVTGQAGDLFIRGASLVEVEGESGAVLVMGVSNEGLEADALISVRVENGDPAELGSSVELPPNQLVQFGSNEVAPGAVYGGTYVLDGPADSLAVGGFVPVSFTFRDAGSTTLELLVQPQTGPYATITPTATPTRGGPTLGSQTTSSPEPTASS